MSEGRIQKLDKEVSDQITSQQVIPTLHQCIKQLVDNSIDANATLIKIQLQEYGKQQFSVYDNGHGIKDVQKIGEGGQTSKLLTSHSNNQDFLQGIRTLGFRGQALSAISTLCKSINVHTVYVANQESQADKYYEQLKYSILSKKILSKKKVIDPQTFTRITVQSLFYSVPVRMYQLNNKSKQNLKKVYDLVFQISLIYPEITFILVNQVDGHQELLLDIQRNQKINQKDLSRLQYFHRNIPEDAWRQRIQACFPKKFENFLVFIKSQNVEGFTLKTIQSGSSKKNAKFPKNYQFTFINRRPINPLKEVCKVFEDYYKKYNYYTKYAFFLNISVQPNEIDINLSPNKRDIIIKKQVLQKILSQIKSIIEKQVIQKIMNIEQFKSGRQKKKEDQGVGQKGDKNEKKPTKSDSVKIRQQVFRSNISQDLYNKQISGNLLGNYGVLNNNLGSSAIQQLNRRVQNVTFKGKNPIKISQSGIKINKYNSQIKPIQQSNKQEDFQQIGRKVEQQQNYSMKNEDSLRNKKKPEYNIKNNLRQNIYKSLNQTWRNNESINKQENSENLRENINNLKENNNLNKQKVERIILDKNQQFFTNNRINNFQQNSVNLVKQQEIDREPNQIYQNQYSQKKQRSIQRMDQNTEQNINQSNNRMKIEPQITLLKDFIRPSNLNYVTDQIKGKVVKDDFRKFHIHGQFNKGFILCTLLSNSQFYIVDQHASQEKRLFQSFIDQKPTFYFLCKQVQLKPLQVDQIQITHEQLVKSGFSYKIENRKTLKITKCPSHFKKHFGFQEFMQIAQTNKNIKQIPLFYNSAASKACRSAVMIGDQLDKRKMTDIVHRMSDLKSPWNCPHGRPSLISLGSFKSIIQKINSPLPKYKF